MRLPSSGTQHVLQAPQTTWAGGDQVSHRVISVIFYFRSLVPDAIAYNSDQHEIIGGKGGRIIVRQTENGLSGRSGVCLIGPKEQVVRRGHGELLPGPDPK